MQAWFIHLKRRSTMAEFITQLDPPRVERFEIVGSQIRATKEVREVVILLRGFSRMDVDCVGPKTVREVPLDIRHDPPSQAAVRGAIAAIADGLFEAPALATARRAIEGTDGGAALLREIRPLLKAMTPTQAAVFSNWADRLAKSRVVSKPRMLTEA
jgi:hypothetical protein